MHVSLLLLLVLGIVSGEQEFHRVNVHSGTTTFTEEVMFDKTENYVMVTVGNANTQPFHPNVNMHDIQSGFSAFKSIHDGKCIVEALNHTMDEFVQRVQDIENGRKVPDVKEAVWNCNNKQITYTQLKDLAGSRIANFCKPYRSFFVTRRTERHESHRQIRAAQMAHVAICYFCVFECGPR